MYNHRGYRLMFNSMVVFLAIGSGCNSGGGESVSVVVGADGGVVQLSDGTKLDIPAGALQSDEKINVSTSNINVGDLIKLGRIYLFQPAGLNFLLPVNITMPLTKDPLPGQNAVLYWSKKSQDTAFEEIFGGYDENNLYHASITHFSYGFIGATSDQPPTDGGMDGGGDAGFDAGIDAGIDAGMDAGVDAGRRFDAGYCLTSQCFAVPPTGQTKCYDSGREDGGPTPDGGEIPCPLNRTDPFWGQDAQSAKARTLNCFGSDGAEKTCAEDNLMEGDVVTDSVTGIMWQRSYATSQTWDGGIDHCDTLVYGSYNDWRLPNPFELASIADSQKYNPAIDSAVFPDTISNYYWTSSPGKNYPTGAWVVNFNNGNVEYGTRTSSKYARCIRQGAAENLSEVKQEPGRFIESEPKSGEKVVTDTVTGLMWQYNYATDIDWKGALAQCATLEYGNHADWRLPNRNELMSLVNYAGFSPASDFPNMPPVEDIGTHWSSTSVSNESKYAWGVWYVYGFVSQNQKNNLFVVRCVRLGP